MIKTLEISTGCGWLQHLTCVVRTCGASCQVALEQHWVGWKLPLWASSGIPKQQSELAHLRQAGKCITNTCIHVRPAIGSVDPCCLQPH